MFGLFKKFKDGFAKTVSAIAEKTAGIFGQKPIDASSLEALEEALYGADFGVETTEEILAEIKLASRKDKELKGQEAAVIGAAVRPPRWAVPDRGPGRNGLIPRRPMTAARRHRETRWGGP